MTPLTAEQIAEIDARFDAGETVWMWAVHHDLRLEPLTERLSARTAYILSYKRAIEQPVRLTWLQPVRDVSRIPLAVVEAGKTYKAALVAFFKARDASYEDSKAYGATLRTHEDDIARHHEDECPGVPWGPDGLIFYRGWRL